ncbi:DUF2141 domain-containing protein [Seonamhaeicola sp. ML3]|uniref:DUF2141 domain-containing protein n=1 Tax=Seonamhaeicola sp. ML3 TaxID=2937786 RepID=UPI00200DFE03|nr:DUF2141 domain-containing protein [Seonamhaeicola sp. ML3]
MQNLATIFSLIVLSVFQAMYSQSEEQNTITVTITNFDTNQGNAVIGLYNSEGDFLVKSYKSIHTNITNHSCKVVFENIPDGVYAISMFHDENDNKILDKGSWGIPKEDYGCSNNAKGFMGPPKWKDAKFEVKGKSINQHIKL